jgi:hypothetical protein
MENKFVNRKLEKRGVVSPCHERLWYHLDNPVPKSRIKYTSPDTQNKIIEISDEMVGEKIVRACNDFEYFDLVDDEAIDVSTHEQACV